MRYILTLIFKHVYLRFMTGLPDTALWLTIYLCYTKPLESDVTLFAVCLPAYITLSCVVTWTRRYWWQLQHIAFILFQVYFPVDDFTKMPCKKSGYMFNGLLFFVPFLTIGNTLYLFILRNKDLSHATGSIIFAILQQTLTSFPDILPFLGVVTKLPYCGGPVSSFL